MKGHVKINPAHKSRYQTFNLQLIHGDLLKATFFDEFSTFMTCIKSTAPGKRYGSLHFTFRDIEALYKDVSHKPQAIRAHALSALYD